MKDKDDKLSFTEYIRKENFIKSKSTPEKEETIRKNRKLKPEQKQKVFLRKIKV